MVGSSTTTTSATIINPIASSSQSVVPMIAPMSDKEDMMHDGDMSTSSGCHPCAVLTGILCCPFTMCSCYTVQVREAAVLLRYGQYEGTVTDAGLHWSNMWGRTIRKVSTKTVSADLPHTKVIDKNGNPLLISGVLTYQFVNPRRAVLDVQNATQFVSTQAQAALKQIVSRYPYESETDPHSLKQESSEIGAEMVHILQQRVNIAGCKIVSFAFNEISYAPEIAAGMLRRQQAAATVAARKTIILGAVEIASGAVEELAERGIHMDAGARAALVTNLLTVICSDRDAQPIVPLAK